MSKYIIWTGAIQSKGYGIVRIDGKLLLAHRVAYKMAHPKEELGPLHVLHRCDVRKCVNPKHLFLGTPQENTDDMMRKGRWKAPSQRKFDGSRFRRKVSPGMAVAIRKDYRKGIRGFGCGSLGRKYGVSETTVFTVINGRKRKIKRKEESRCRAR